MSFVNSWHRRRILILFFTLVTCKAYNEHDVEANRINGKISGQNKAFGLEIEKDVKKDKNLWDFNYHIEKNNRLRVRGGKRHFDYIDSNQNIKRGRKLEKGKRKIKQPPKKTVTKNDNTKEAKNPNVHHPVIGPDKTSSNINEQVSQNENESETIINQAEDVNDEGDAIVDDTSLHVKQDLPPIPDFENDDSTFGSKQNDTVATSISISPTQSPSMPFTQIPSTSFTLLPSSSPSPPLSQSPSLSLSNAPSISSSLSPSISSSSSPSISSSLSPSISSSSKPTTEKKPNDTKSSYLNEIESHEVKMPTFTIYISAIGESNIDQDLLVNLTKEHLSVVFSQNIYFHHLDLQILDTNLDRKLKYTSPENSFFIFDGSAWFIDKKFIPKDIRTLIARSFDDYYLTSYVGQLRSSGIDAMSIHVDSSSQKPSLTSSEEMLTTEENDEPRPRNLQDIFIGFALVVCVVILVSYTLYQREVTGIDSNYTEDDDGRIDLEFEIVTCQKKPAPVHPNNNIFQERGHDNIDSFHSDLSSFDKSESDYYYTRNAYSTTTFVEPDVSAITAETSFERQQLYEIS